MRVTHRMIIDNAIRSMSDNLQKLSKLQRQASSGKRFESSSDAPGASRAALALKSNINANESYLGTLQRAEHWLTASGQALGELNDLSLKAINRALEGISDTNAQARSNLAEDLDGLIQDAVASGNTRHQGNYLFSGFQVKTEPFTLVSGSPDTVTYAGDTGEITRRIGPDHSLKVNFDPDQVISPLFEAMISARDALRADDTTGLQTAVEDLKSAQELIKDQLATNGLRLQQVEDNQSYLEETQLALENLLSHEEDIDLVEVITELRHQETVYQTTLEVGHRTMATVNLFDLLK